MRTTLILTAAALTAFSLPAVAQVTTPSQTAAPVMPAPRADPNPNSNVTPLNNGAAPIAPEGRAAAPEGETVPNGNVKEKARSGANGG